MAPHSLTGSPHSRSRALTARTLQVRSWKIDAASAASARPTENTSTKCSGAPAPPDAMTGMPTASETAAVSRQSNPRSVPSASMEVSRISPAPRASASRAHSTASHEVARAPGVAADDESSGLALRVDGDDDGLAAEASGDARDERRVANRGGVDGDLVGPGVDDPRRIVDGPDAPAHREGNEHVRGDGRHGAHEGEPVLRGGGDVEHDQLVDAFGVVSGGEPGRVAGVAEPVEVHALHDAAGPDVEAGDQAPWRTSPARGRSSCAPDEGAKHGEALVAGLLGVELHAADVAERARPRRTSSRRR